MCWVVAQLQPTTVPNRRRLLAGLAGQKGVSYGQTELT
jgi:hypothetical protein